jgi:hypothetical protein
MSRQSEKIVYTASWRDLVSVKFSERSFSTATGRVTHRGIEDAVICRLWSADSGRKPPGGRNGDARSNGKRADAHKVSPFGPLLEKFVAFLS